MKNEIISPVGISKPSGPMHIRLPLRSAVAAFYSLPVKPLWTLMGRPWDTGIQELRLVRFWKTYSGL